MWETEFLEIVIIRLKFLRGLGRDPALKVVGS